MDYYLRMSNCHPDSPGRERISVRIKLKKLTEILLRPKKTCESFWADQNDNEKPIQ